jgi:hypothetical protein
MYHKIDKHHIYADYMRHYENECDIASKTSAFDGRLG